MLLKAIIDHFDVECAVFNSEHVPGNTKSLDPDLVGFAFLSGSAFLFIGHIQIYKMKIRIRQHTEATISKLQ